MHAAIAGFTLALSLILAIGAQNAFILKQGLRREYVFPLCLFCAVSDALLISAGVFGFAFITSKIRFFIPLARWAGFLFLFFYGARSFYSAWKSNEALGEGEESRGTLTSALFTCLAFTWFNPHVYLDTVLLVGSIGAQQPLALRPWFVAGASFASLFWFGMLGFGARWLAPWFARPKAWQVLDGLIGLTMWVLALLLVKHALSS